MNLPNPNFNDFKDDLQMLVLFVTTQILGLLTAYRLRFRDLSSTPVSQGSVPWIMIGVVGVSALLMGYIYRNKMYGAANTWIYTVYALSSFIVFDSFLGVGATMLLVTALLMTIHFSESDGVVSALLAVCFAGAAAIMGIVLTVQNAAIFMILYMTYDVIAVKGGFMGSLVQETDRSSFPGFKIGSRVLGGGDVIVPLIFAITVLEYGLQTSALTAGGSFFGLLALKAVIWKKIVPAAPFVCIGAFIGFAFSLLI
ncbi:MAG: hypothetical protein BRC28_01905 [Nanohaloarchaea archaeon SW_4_43_9]|nr:MAG: hypothetical protein BRC28_01905 [Nanohaloarchaea archaeon SW_4_43_9]